MRYGWLVGLAMVAHVAAGCGAEAEAGAANGTDAVTVGDAASGDVTATTDATTTSETADSTPDTGPVVPACAGKTAYRWDPLHSDTLLTFPDDAYTMKDPSSPSGQRVVVDDKTPWMKNVPVSLFENVYRAIAGLDGFGTTAGITLRFSAAVPAPEGGVAGSLAETAAVRLYELGTKSATRVGYETEIADDGATLILWPARPLRPKTRHVAVVTRAHKAKDGDCIAPSPVLADLLAGKAEAGLAPLVPRAKEALEAIGIAASDVSALALFSTQSIEENSLAVRDDVYARTYGWQAAATCKDESKGTIRHCEAKFAGKDYRRQGEIQAGKPQQDLVYPVSFWLPSGKGPWPTILFGHGIGGDRGQAGYFAEFAAKLGTAVVAIDAVGHGAHPAGGASDSQTAVFNFFSVDLTALKFDPLAMRDNWRQSTYDKLQLIRALEASPDIDGDKAPDIDTSRLAYLGISLGGIMGNELLALSDSIRGANLMVCGGRVSTIIKDGANWQSLVAAVAGLAGATDGDVARFFPVLQTVIERGDAANYAPRVLKDRFTPDSKPPSVLLQMAVGDTTMPNATSAVLARAYGLPIVGADPYPVPLLDKVAAPVKGNLGDATIGFFQFDRVTTEPGKPPVKADHGLMPGSLEGLTQSAAFLSSWLQGGAPTISDPYATLGTPALK